MGWELVVGSVAGQESNVDSLEGSDRELGRRSAIRGVYCDLLSTVEEVVEPRPAEYANHAVPSWSGKS